MRRGLYRLNNIVSNCLLNALNCVSSRKFAGKLFLTQGPATQKLLSPKVLCVRGMKHVLSLAEQRLKILYCCSSSEYTKNIQKLK